MSGNIRLPNITGKTVEEQAQQMKSYLTQLAGELNWALDNMNGVTGGSSGYIPYRSANTGGAGSDVQKKTEELLKNFSDLKGLIIKSADIVNAYYEEINTRLSGLYVAQSEYGTFVQETTSVLTQNSTGITQNYTNLQLVTGRVTLAEEKIESTKEELTGIIDETKQDLQETIDATEQALQKTIADTDENLRGVIDAQDKALRETIDQVDADLQGVVADTEARLAKTVADTESGLQNTINQAKQDMIDDIDSAEERMLENIGGVEQNLNKNISDTSSALAQNIADTKGALDQNIDNAKNDLQKDIDGAKKDLSESIKDAEEALDGKIDKTKQDLEKNIADAEKNLKDLLDDATAILVDVRATIKSGLLYYDENSIPIYGLEVGQTTKVNGIEVFNQFARFTADRLSFFDPNGNEVAYISDKKLFITHAEITGTLTLGKFVDEVIDGGKGIVTKWIGGG